ncbi:MAG: WYL domain-containing protein [Myxococcaceae bacterium]|nr:WYL domain-containing protein [Myxococcaceae bacterium]
MPAHDVHGRLRRLLFLVPFVAKNPGQHVDDVAKALGVTREALLEELDLLTMVGRPPFQPDDFVDIYVEDDRIYVDLDQRFSAPPRLTAAEGVALAAAAELLRPAATDALTKALEKLEKVLPDGARARYRAMSKQLDLALEAPVGLAALSQAIVERREVELDYFTQGRNQTEKRRVQPHELFSHRGQWYLQGHCLTRNDERLFRLDRIRGLELSESRFTPPADQKAQPMPGLTAKADEVRVRFNAAAAPYVAERFGSEVKWLEGGVLEVKVPGDSERWLTQWVLSFGGDAWVQEPEWARKAVHSAAEAIKVTGA